MNESSDSPASPSDTYDDESQETRPPLSTSQRILALMLGAILALSIVIIGVLVMLRLKAVPELTPGGFLSAQERWEQVAPDDYQIETEVEGLQPATYRVRVRDGQVVSAHRNDYPLKDLRTVGTWSVPGMFGTMQRDVDRNAQSENGQELVHLRAEFDSKYGYPARYVRLEWGTKVTTSWSVQRFEVGVASESQKDGLP